MAKGFYVPRVYRFLHSSNLGAENETRTRDPDLGKVVLYQLSYFRRGLVYYGCKDSVFRGLHQIFLLFFIGC